VKAVTPKEMARIESLSYQKGCQEDAFMQNAGKGIAQCADSFVQEHALGEQVLLLCGSGNNAGDAYVAGIELLSYGYQVTAYPVVPYDKCSPLCQKYSSLFQKMGGITTGHLEFSNISILIDGLFGTGFHGEVREPFASVIKQANQSKKPILAVDIPSGLDGETGIVKGEAIVANATVFLGLPKIGFFLNDGWNHVGQLFPVDFGLPKEFIDQAKSDLKMVDLPLLKIPKIVRNRNKYQAGHVVGLGGSPGMPGAPVMSSMAALRTGSGIVHLLYPKEIGHELSSTPLELIKIGVSYENVEEILNRLNQADAAFIGPGLGREESTRKLLRTLLPRLEKPCVIDADALFFLSEEEVSLPKNAILTPHGGEMVRLLKINSRLTFDPTWLERCQNYVDNKKVTLVLKGGPSFILQPGKKLFVCPRGTPGLATAGSGDILTGIIASLLSQGLSPIEAAITGVYLHALSGEEAAKILTPFCMNATDILDYLPQAYREMGLF